MREHPSPPKIEHRLRTPEGKTNIPPDGDSVLVKNYICCNIDSYPTEFFFKNPKEETVSLFIRYDLMHDHE